MWGQRASGAREWRSVPNPEVLKELTDSKYNVYDILSTFYSHEDPWIILGVSKFAFAGSIEPNALKSCL